MSWPTTLVSYKKTDRFDQDTVPAGFLANHQTKAGVWAMIRVVEGEIDLVQGDESERLTSKIPGFVEPEAVHHLNPVGPVVFYVEFFRDANEAG